MHRSYDNYILGILKSKESSENFLRQYLMIAENYLQCPEAFIRTYSVIINGKHRRIITYKGDENGLKLKKLHTVFRLYLEIHNRHAANSYAYKNGSDIFQCLNRHLQSNVFFKTDIHAYFDSIDYDILLKIIKKRPSARKNADMFDLILKACFYDGKLPIGFTSSPVLSDMYLRDLDKKYLKRKDVVYTRYADDLIISVVNPDDHKSLENAKNEISEELKKMKLSLNSKKTYFRHLRIPGDAIHLLGLNLVKTDTSVNRITISDKYLREISRELCELIESNDPPDDMEKAQKFNRIFGRIQFVAHASEGSMTKLKKMLSVKTGVSFDLKPKILREICHVSKPMVSDQPTYISSKE